MSEFDSLIQGCVDGPVLDTFGDSVTVKKESYGQIDYGLEPYINAEDVVFPALVDFDVETMSDFDQVPVRMTTLSAERKFLKDLRQGTEIIFKGRTYYYHRVIEDDDRWIIAEITS